MTEYKTLRVPEEAYELAQDAKQDDETWGEYLRRCSDNPPEVREFVEGGLEDEIEKLQELVERVPQETAEAISRRYE